MDVGELAVLQCLCSNLLAFVRCFLDFLLVDGGYQETARSFRKDNQWTNEQVLQRSVLDRTGALGGGGQPQGGQGIEKSRAGGQGLSYILYLKHLLEWNQWYHSIHRATHGIFAVSSSTYSLLSCGLLLPSF